MSQENVELSRALIEAFNAHDVEAMVRFVHPEIEWLPAIEAEVAGEPEVYRGPDAVREYFTRVIPEYWEDYRFDITDSRDLGDQVLLVGRFHARGTSSGAETSFEGAAVHHWLEGKCLRADTYTSTDAALEAVGLSE
jgi:ketosteroid isomerase-like protein